MKGLPVTYSIYIFLMSHVYCVCVCVCVWVQDWVLSRAREQRLWVLDDSTEESTHDTGSTPMTQHQLEENYVIIHLGLPVVWHWYSSHIVVLWHSSDHLSGRGFYCRAEVTCRFKLSRYLKRWIRGSYNGMEKRYPLKTQILMLLRIMVMVITRMLWIWIWIQRTRYLSVASWIPVHLQTAQGPARAGCAR